MKNPILRKRALERLYQKALRLLREDKDKLLMLPQDWLADDFDEEKRAKAFVASMSNQTQVLLATYVQEQYGFDALEEFTWLMPPLAGCIFAFQAALNRSPEKAMVD